MCYEKEIQELWTHIDNWLIKDLRNLEKIEGDKNGNGGCNFPMIQTILSGMELLGLLLSGGKKDRDAFIYFWKNHFILRKPEYKDLEEIFYKFIRCGTAHYFFPKHNIKISKERLISTPSFSKEEGTIILCIPAHKLLNDFIEVYNEIKVSQISDNLKKGYDALKENMSVSKKEIQNVYNNKNLKNPSTPRSCDSIRIEGSMNKLGQ